MTPEPNLSQLQKDLLGYLISDDDTCLSLTARYVVPVAELVALKLVTLADEDDILVWISEAGRELAEREKYDKSAFFLTSYF